MKKDYFSKHKHFTKCLRRYCNLFLSLIVLISIGSCNEDPLKDMTEGEALGATSRAANSLVDLSSIDVSLSFDVITKRSTSFKNGITDDSPGWKKHAARSETESYSYSFEIDNGGVSYVIDNYSFDCLEQKRKLENSQMSRFEYNDGSYISYDGSGNIIDQGSGASMKLDQWDLLGFNGLDTAQLSEMAINYEVVENKIAGVVDRSNGLGFSGTFVYDANIERMLYVALKDEDDQISSIISNEYDQQGRLLSSVKLFYDYLEDGDIMTTQERSTYSNFILYS